MDVYVEIKEDGLFKWKIQWCFPMMEVEFKRAWVIINGTTTEDHFVKGQFKVKMPGERALYFTFHYNHT